MRKELLENCFASYKTVDNIRKAIFVDKNGEEVIAITDEDVEADYFDWLDTEVYNENVKIIETKGEANGYDM